MDGNETGISEYWRFCDELTITQAVLLQLGIDPSDMLCEVPRGFEALKNAIIFDVERNRINGVVTRDSEGVIMRDSLIEWLQSRGIKTGFFFPMANDQPDYLDQKHPRYAPKLAAAVNAWIACTEPGAKTPKQSLVKWLREHAAQYGLSDSDGNPNELGIEEVAKIANWKPGGGVPKTPG